MRIEPGRNGAGSLKRRRESVGSSESEPNSSVSSHAQRVRNKPKVKEILARLRPEVGNGTWSRIMTEVAAYYLDYRRKIVELKDDTKEAIKAEFALRLRTAITKHVPEEQIRRIEMDIMHSSTQIEDAELREGGELYRLTGTKQTDLGSVPEPTIGTCTKFIDAYTQESLSGSVKKSARLEPSLDGLINKGSPCRHQPLLTLAIAAYVVDLKDS